MNKEKVLYCFMNKQFEFIDEDWNPTENIEEIIGYESLEDARKQRKELDEPEEWKIVKIKTIRVLEEIIDE